MFRRSPEAILNAGQVELREEVGARLVERGREEDEAELVGERRAARRTRPRSSSSASRCSPYVAPKLFSLSYGLSYSARVKRRAVVALLELDRVDPGVLRRVEELLRPLDAPLVVVADLGDDEAGRVVRDPPPGDGQLAHRAIGTPRPGPFGRSRVVRSGASAQSTGHPALITLLVGSSLVGAASVCLTALLRPPGRVAFCLGVAVVATAEVVAISHALSLVDAYERSWFLAASALAAAAAVVAIALVRPPWPSLDLRAVARELLRDRLVTVLAAVVAVEFVYLLALALFTPPAERDVLDVPPHAGAALDPAGVGRADRTTRPTRASTSSRRTPRSSRAHDAALGVGALGRARAACGARRPPFWPSTA